MIDPTIDLMIKMGLTPNAITAAGFVGNLFAMWMFIEAAMRFQAGSSTYYILQPFDLILWGGIIILLAGLFDMMDGRLARRGNLSSIFGALWDSTLDRYSEMVTLFGICLIFMTVGDFWFGMGVITFAAMVGSIMVSYVRARAEALNIECKVGVMQRPERVVVTAITAIITGATHDLSWLAGGMAIIAILANITAVWRIIHCYKHTKHRPTVSDEDNE
jgi:CDP-diacylglycerol--glycerol-3-phosphate 3-phosphatidyltransferase